MMFDAPTNADRAEWAQVAVDAFMALGGTDECDAIPDLITNLCHLARRQHVGTEPFDAGAYLASRAMMHDMEVSDDDEGN